ncbi:MAG: hypothetical protein Q9167_000967 [Letrouitia subvulpina]
MLMHSLHSLHSLLASTSLLARIATRTSTLTQQARMASTLPKLSLFETIANHNPDSTAVIHSSSGRRFTYGQLLKDVADSRDTLRQSAGGRPVDGQRVAFLVENGYDYVGAITFLSILGANGIAVPLSSGFPATELQYILDNCEAFMVLSSRKFQGKVEEVAKEGLEHKPIFSMVEKKLKGSQSSQEVRLENNNAKSNQSGMMLYTSGTTSRPKGVLLPEPTLTAQCHSLIQAWHYTPQDHLLHVLPLHHIHGTVNALLAALFAGSAIEFLFPFNAQAVWKRLAAPFLPDRQIQPKITFLTVVPTIYNRLLASHNNSELKNDQVLRAAQEAIRPENLRLNISGSAALPTPIKEAWNMLSGGNVLLERYGMTEVGMALSCGLDFADRVDGSVGWPLPLVEARLVDTETGLVIPLGQEKDGEGREREGEIQLRGPTVFQEYWRNLSATAAEFVEGDDGKGKWFKTGDIATRRIVEGAGKSKQEWAKGPMYFIQGRKSVDIIKSGGEKVSALEIERELLSLPQVAEAAVMGVASEQWGQKVAAVVVLKEGQEKTGRAGKQWGVMDMRRALREKLAGYKIPQELRVVEKISKNAMGKEGYLVNKKSLVKEIFG